MLYPAMARQLLQRQQRRGGKARQWRDRPSQECLRAFVQGVGFRV